MQFLVLRSIQSKVDGLIDGEVKESPEDSEVGFYFGAQDAVLRG